MLNINFKKTALCLISSILVVSAIGCTANKNDVVSIQTDHPVEEQSTDVEKITIVDNSYKISVALRYSSTEGESFTDFQKVTSESAEKDISQSFVGMNFTKTSESYDDTSLNYRILLNNGNSDIGEIRFYDLDKIIFKSGDKLYTCDKTTDEQSQLIEKMVTDFKPIIFN